MPGLLHLGAETIDPPFHAALARTMGSVSAASAALAFSNWLLHLAVSPGLQADLVRLACSQAGLLANHEAAAIAADEWRATVPESEGSWWPAWQGWLAVRAAPPTKPRRPGPSLCAAPGTYVLQK